MANNSKTNKTAASVAAPPPSKLDTLISALGKKAGATIEELAAATGWQKHSVRGAMAGTLKRKGHSISSTKTDGIRRYRLEPSA